MLQIGHRAKGAKMQSEDTNWDIWACAGFALFCAQELEEKLRTFCDLPQNPVLHWPNYQGAFSKGEISSATLGGLVALAQQKFDSEDEELIVQLGEARDLRNYLVHHFFDSHRRSEYEPKKKQRMMNEAGMIATRFQVLTELLAQRVASRPHS